VLLLNLGGGDYIIMYCKDVTLDQIENMRLELLLLAEEKGHTHEDTVIASQLLDNLLNEYDVVSNE